MQCAAPRMSADLKLHTEWFCHHHSTGSTNYMNPRDPTYAKHLSWDQVGRMEDRIQYLQQVPSSVFRSGRGWRGGVLADAPQCAHCQVSSANHSTTCAFTCNQSRPVKPSLSGEVSSTEATSNSSVHLPLLSNIRRELSVLRSETYDCAASGHVPIKS